MGGRGDAFTEDALALLSASVRILFANGQTTKRVMESVEQLGRALGLTVTVFPRWGEITLRIEGAGFQGAAHLELISIAPAGMEMHKVTEALNVIDAVCAGTMDPAQARAALAKAEHLPPISLVRFALMAAAGAASLAVLFGSLDIASLLVIALTAGAGACLRRLLAGLFPSPLPQPLAAAFLTGIVAALASRLMPNAAVYLIALCPAMILVPGPHLLNGAIDLARLRVALGTARIGYASLIILLICVGLIAGLLVGRHTLPTSGPTGAVTFGFDVICAGIAVAAYGSFFSMPWRTLLVPVVVGMFAHACHWIALQMGATISVADFIACVIVGAVITPLSLRMRLPFAAMAFASVVSLIPGSYLFRMSAALVGILNSGPNPSVELLMPAIIEGTTALTIIVAMAFGLILSKVVVEQFFPQRPR